MPYRDKVLQKAAKAASERRRRANTKLRGTVPVSPVEPVEPATPLLPVEMQLRTATDALVMLEQAYRVLRESGADGVSIARTLTTIAQSAGRIVSDGLIEQRMTLIERRLAAQGGD